MIKIWADLIKIGPILLAATHVGDTAATSIVVNATTRIILICVHGFTFYG
jgi:hypothetical protein